MITLRTKITIIVSLVTSVLMVSSAYYEAHYLTVEGQVLERENQAVQIGNILTSVVDGIWDFDHARTEAVIRGLFDAKSTRRVQVIDPLGKVYVGLDREGSHGEPAVDLLPQLVPDQAQKPQSEWNETRLQTLKFVRLNDVRWQVIAPLWQSSVREKRNFIGHLLVEYSLEESIARSKDMMIRLLIGGFIIASLIVFFLSIALQYFVLKPVQTLMEATRSIASGSFETAISIDTHDEMAILAHSFDSMRIKLKEFTFNLQDLVRQRTAELEDEKRKIQNILIHINEGILTFDSEFQIDPEISSKLVQVLRQERSAIVGHNLFDLVFRDSKVSANDLDQIRAALLSILGEDSVAALANGGLLPREIHIASDSQWQVLDLDWVPIVDDSSGLVGRMMLTIRDITEKRQMEQQMHEARAAHASFLRILSDIVHVGVGRTKKVLDDAEQRIRVLVTRLEAGEVLPHEESFPLLHTIKGNLRSLKFNSLIEEIHLAEEVIIKQRSAQGFDLRDLSLHLRRYLDAATEYNEVLKRVWGENAKVSQGHLLSMIDSLLGEVREALAQSRIEIGTVEVKDSVNQWSHQGLLLLSDVLVHALGNTLDHGYLRPLARGQRVDKFSFQLVAKRDKDRVKLLIADSGCGIGMEQIRELHKQRAKAVDEADPYKILFENSVSTASDVTLRSGRGVGLFAIRDVVTKSGGQVKASSSEKGGFQLEIDLPVSVLLYDQEVTFAA